MRLDTGGHKLAANGDRKGPTTEPLSGISLAALS